MPADRLDQWLAGLASGRKVSDTSVPEELCSRVRLWAQLAPALPWNSTGGWLVYREADEVRAVPLQDGKVVGREAPAEIVVACPWLSRRHFAIRRGENGFELEDLGGKNATQLGGRPVVRATLASVDVITVGDQHFLFVDAGGSDSVPAVPPRPGGML